MNEHCIVVGNGLLMPKYMAEDDIPRTGGRWQELRKLTLNAEAQEGASKYE